MIRKKDKNLLKWASQNIIDFEEVSELNNTSTYEDVRKFLRSISQKDKVQKYGIYSTRYYFLEVSDLDDIIIALKKGEISEHTCNTIRRWNKAVKRENWDMDDIDKLLYPDIEKSISRNFLRASLMHLIDSEVIESFDCNNKGITAFKLTEKGEAIFEK